MSPIKYNISQLLRGSHPIHLVCWSRSVCCWSRSVCCCNLFYLNHIHSIGVCFTPLHLNSTQFNLSALNRSANLGVFMGSTLLCFVCFTNYCCRKCDQIKCNPKIYPHLYLCLQTQFRLNPVQTDSFQPKQLQCTATYLILIQSN